MPSPKLRIGILCALLIVLAAVGIGAFASLGVVTTPSAEARGTLEIAESRATRLYNAMPSGVAERSALAESIREARQRLKNPLTAEEKLTAALAKLTAASQAGEKSLIGDDGTLRSTDMAVIEKLLVGEAECALDARSGTFYYPLSLAVPSVPVDLQGVSGEKYVRLSIEGFNLTDFRPEVGKSYQLTADTDALTYTFSLVFTGLPVVQLSLNGQIGDSYRVCEFSITDPDADQYHDIYLPSEALIHIRGGIARSFPKKSYALKLTGDLGENRDVSLLGMRTDSDWILDAMYIDKARMRNRVTTDIWNDFSSPLYYEDVIRNSEMQNGTSGKFVEVFLNDSYLGLYCLTTKIDRKQLGLARYDMSDGTLHGMIYKGFTWEDAILFRSYRPARKSASDWGGFEQKYPNPAKGEPTSWEPIFNLVSFVIDSDDTTFAERIGDYIDIDNFVDYTIIQCMTLAYDNTGKNAYWSVYDVSDPALDKFFITVWDMDATFGRSWDASPLKADLEWMDSCAEHDSKLYRRLVLTNAGGFRDRLIARWKYLRDRELAVASMAKRFEVYFDLFDHSGAWERERLRWRESELDIAGERSYVAHWLQARWTYIDDYIVNRMPTFKTDADFK